LIDAADPAATLANLTEHATQAHLLVMLEMAVVITQALAAVYFYKLFRPINPTAAYATATFGLVNSVAIIASGAFMATANAVASDSSLAPGGDAAGTVGLLYELSASSWGMGNLFFGLWLIPMGWVAVASGRFPRVLGWTLVVGGVGYLLSGLLAYGLADAPSSLLEGLTLPASIGEFWMIGYLLLKGIRPAAPSTAAPSTVAPSTVAASHTASHAASGV